MVFFNDPVPCPDPAERAVKMAMAMREEAGRLIATWRRDGCELGFGAGIARGYATLGQIGFSERSGYTAIGTVCNLAARLCAEAKDGQILISSRVARAVEAVARLEDLGNLELRGLRRPVAVFNVVQSTDPAEARPNLTVVASGPGACSPDNAKVSNLPGADPIEPAGPGSVLGSTCDGPAAKAERPLSLDKATLAGASSSGGLAP